MIMGNKEIGIRFGALADPIEKQLSDQGLTASEKSKDEFKRLNEARLHLLFAGCITDSENDKICKKIFNKLKKSVKPIKQ
jgi:hypothetical protein